MHDILVSALKVVLWPLIYPIDRKIKHRNDVRNGRRAPYDSKPAKLDIKSRRPITPPFPESSSSFSLLRRINPSYNDQAASPLLSKLPLELRLMIWELCLQNAVHLYWQDGHMLGHPCFEDMFQEELCANHGKCYSRQKLSRGAKPSSGGLALVLTCRRM